MTYAIRKIELECPDRIDPRRLLEFLESWLRHHVLVVDRDYIPTLKGGYGQRKTDITTPLGAAAGDKQSNAEELVTLPVQVPFSAVNVIRRCARLLRLGEAGAKAIEDITDPISSMTVKDALTIARIVLRPDERR